MKRKPINKETRRQVYEKYNGHCAYCGCKLDYKYMQVDHVIPVYWTDDVLRNRYEGDVDTVDNYMPSCKMCNFYKSTFGIKDFRKRIETIPDRLEKVFIYRLGIKYGFIKVQKPNIKFYFEEGDEK